MKIKIKTILKNGEITYDNYEVESVMEAFNSHLNKKFPEEENFQELFIKESTPSVLVIAKDKEYVATILAEKI